MESDGIRHFFLLGVGQFGVYGQCQNFPGSRFSVRAGYVDGPRRETGLPVQGNGVKHPASDAPFPEQFYRVIPPGDPYYKLVVNMLPVRTFHGKARAVQAIQQL